MKTAIITGSGHRLAPEPQRTGLSQGVTSQCWGANSIPSECLPASSCVYRPFFNWRWQRGLGRRHTQFLCLWLWRIMNARFLWENRSLSKKQTGLWVQMGCFNCILPTLVCNWYIFEICWGPLFFGSLNELGWTICHISKDKLFTDRDFWREIFHFILPQ